jgi:NADH-quinone oxidoreductase subunit F
MTAAGSPLGSASMIIVDDTVDIDWLVNKTVHFFAHESCGKCTPCREGTYWMAHVARRITEGKAAPEDIALLDNIAAQIQGKCLCALGEFSTMAVRSGIEKFRADFEARMERVPNG